MTPANEAKRRRNEKMKATSLFPKHSDNQLLRTKSNCEEKRNKQRHLTEKKSHAVDAYGETADQDWKPITTFTTLLSISSLEIKKKH